MTRQARLAALSLLAAFSTMAAHAADTPADDKRRKQEILFSEIPEHVVGDAAFDVSPTATSKLPLELEIVSGPAVLDGKKIRLTGVPGLVIVRASQAGNLVFLPARPAERAFTVRPSPSAPEIVVEPAVLGPANGSGGVIAVKATGEPPPAYQWRKDGTPITGANGDKLMAEDAGTYDVIVSNSAGTVKSRSVTLAASRRFQTINFQALNTFLTANQSVTLNASASSGLPVKFEVVSGPGFLLGNTLTSNGPGAVIVKVTQGGDSSYEPATPATQTFTFTASSGQLRP